MAFNMTRNLKRVMRDYQTLVQEGPENGIWIKPAIEDNLDLFYIMLRGPSGPYEGSLFFFTLEPWYSYNAEENANGITFPGSPPRVLHVSPFSIRAHPNLYHTGGDFVIRSATSSGQQVVGAKVCLSILNTWTSSWTPMNTFMHIFQSILSILDSEPLRNEPGYEKGAHPQIPIYTKYVQFCCLKETLEKTFYPTLTNEIPAKNNILQMFCNEIKDIWLKNHEWYFKKVQQLEQDHAGKLIESAAYHDKNYVGKPYKINILEKLKEHIPKS